MKSVGPKVSKSGPEILRLSEWLQMGPNGALVFPTRCLGHKWPKLFSKIFRKLAFYA